MSEEKQEQEEEKKENKQIIITEECYNKYKETNYGINDFYILFKDLQNNDPLIKFKGLVGMRKLCQEEIKKEKSKKIFNVLINYLLDFIKNYPEEYQYESLILLKNIEKINLKEDEKLKIKKDCELIDIAFSVIKGAKDLKIKTLTLSSYFSYANLLINDDIILKKMISKQIINYIINAIKDFMNEPIILKCCLKICTSILNNKESENWESELLNLLEDDDKKPEDIIKLLPNIISQYANEIKILKYCLIIIEEFTHNGNSENLNKIMQLNIMEKIIQLIDNEDGDIIHWSLRIIGNFAMNNDSIYTQHIIDFNALDALKKTLKKEYDEKNKNIRKESSFTISNIAAGTQEQLIKLYENNFYDILTEIIQNENENQIKKNCLWAIYNFSCIKNQEYLEKLVEKGFMKIIVNRFNYDQGEVLACSLEALGNILELEKKVRDPAKVNIIEKEINNLDLLNAIKNLNKNNNEDLCQQKTNYLLNTYFIKTM